MVNWIRSGISINKKFSDGLIFCINTLGKIKFLLGYLRQLNDFCELKRPDTQYIREQIMQFGIF